MADFLPASLATIVSYFLAEVSRGVWKPVFMNGTDWPSPAAHLSNVGEKIKKILAATGFDVPSLAAGLFLLLFPNACFAIITSGSCLARQEKKGRGEEKHFNLPHNVWREQIIRSSGFQSIIPHLIINITCSTILFLCSTCAKCTCKVICN